LGTFPISVIGLNSFSGSTALAPGNAALMMLAIVIAKTV
jgi:hypothetical protein